jgi:ABC-type Fe3+-siderophore transport system permease subunit
MTATRLNRIFVAVARIFFYYAMTEQSDSIFMWLLGSLRNSDMKLNPSYFGLNNGLRVMT